MAPKKEQHPPRVRRGSVHIPHSPDHIGRLPSFLRELQAGELADNMNRTLVTVDLESPWIAEITIEAQNGVPVVSRVEVRHDRYRDLTYDKNLTPENPDAMIPLPDGGLTTRVFRSLTFGEARDEARKHLAELQDDELAAHHFDRDGVASPRQPGRPGRKGREPGYYADIAGRYVQAHQRGSKKPIEDVAGQTGFSASYVRKSVHEARRRGLLTPTRQGASGGELTEAGKALLDARKRHP